MCIININTNLVRLFKQPNVFILLGCAHQNADGLSKITSLQKPKFPHLAVYAPTYCPSIKNKSYETLPFKNQLTCIDEQERKTFHPKIYITVYIWRHNLNYCCITIQNNKKTTNTLGAFMKPFEFTVTEDTRNIERIFTILFNRIAVSKKRTRK